MSSGRTTDLSSLPPMYAIMQQLHRRYDTCFDVVERLIYRQITVEQLFRSQSVPPVSVSFPFFASPTLDFI
jgi:hypothetical protein